MDILEPELVWVEDRCYRFCDSIVWSTEQSSVSYQEDNYGQEFENMSNDMCSDDELQIDSTTNNCYKHLFHVPKAFYGFIIGVKGTTMKKIQTETKTSIVIPKIESKHEEIEITGRTRASVASCRRRIDLIIESSRSKIKFTHFVSIPLNSKAIMDNYENFKNEILRDPQNESNAIHKDIFVKSEKLHLTLGMLRLLNDNEKSDATKALATCNEEIIKPILSKVQKPIIIKIQGVNYMNDDPSKVSVLYGTILKNNILQEIADKIFNYFIQKDLMSVEYSEEVKLHMTLMKSSAALKKHQRPKKFNATKILEDYKDYYFGEIPLKTINISECSTESADQHYNILTEINLSS